MQGCANRGSRRLLALLDQGLTQAEIASLLSTPAAKVGRSSVGHWANARCKPRYSQRKRLLEKFEIPLDWWEEPPANDVVAAPATDVAIALRAA